MVKANTVITLMVVLVVAVVGSFIFVGNQITSELSATGTTADLQEGEKEKAKQAELSCGVQQVSQDFRTVDTEKVGTELSGKSQYVYATGEKGVDGALGNVTADGSQTLGTQRTYQTLSGWTDSTYYAQKQEFTTGCSDDSTTLKVAKAAQPTVTFVNDDGITKNADSTGEQTIDADDEREVTMKLRMSTDVFYGAGDANSMVSEYDETYFESVEVLDGNTILDTGVIPRDFGFHNSTYDGREAYGFDQLLPGTETEYTVRIASDSSNNPTSDEAVRFSLYDANYDIDGDTGKVILDVQDEAKNILSLKPLNKTFYVD